MRFWVLSQIDFGQIGIQASRSVTDVFRGLGGKKIRTRPLRSLRVGVGEETENGFDVCSVRPVKEVNWKIQSNTSK